MFFENLVENLYNSHWGLIDEIRITLPAQCLKTMNFIDCPGFNYADRYHEYRLIKVSVEPNFVCSDWKQLILLLVPFFNEI